jgi:hypothetical protein
MIFLKKWWSGFATPQRPVRQQTVQRLWEAGLADRLRGVIKPIAIDLCRVLISTRAARRK